MALMEKYADVVDLLSKLGLKGAESKEEGGKLILRGAAPFQLEKDAVWDAIKKHAGWESELVADIKVESTDVYGYHTVKSGDTLSKLAKSFYDDASKYLLIFNANKGILPNPDTIKVGQKLTIPNK